MTPPNTTQIFLDTLRAALQPEASPDARAQGATVCRALLTALTTPAGQPLHLDSAPTTPATPTNAPPAAHAAPPHARDTAPYDHAPPPDAAPSPTMPNAPLAGLNPATLAAALRQLTPDQILDLAISRLRAALPADAATTAPAVQPVRFHLIPLPQLP